MRRRSFILALALCALGVSPCHPQNTWQAEADRLAALLQWHPAEVVAEIGAGKGQLSLAAAQRVGPAGKVYTTELDPATLAKLKELASKHLNITAIDAADNATNLPAVCCDSVFMRLVYHHLTKPADIDASLFRAVKLGGRLAVIDEDPHKGSSVPKGVPQNRGGHGIPQKILIAELTAAGFKLDSVDNDWPGRDAYHQMYCIIFDKPKP